jgi:anti-sigma factor RsiW
VSEAELHGFVDGGLDRGRREAVKAFLAESPADAARVETSRRFRIDGNSPSAVCI